MTTRLCAHCGQPFEPRPQVPDQAFCSAPECQRARKRDWQRAKLQSDPDYRINQQAAQRAWSQRNHDYWRNHRDAQQVNPDDLPDLVAEILAHAVEVRQRRRLNLGYRSRDAVLNRVRGRIDVLNTERHRLLDRGLVACRFDELTIDTPRNRFVRSALETISRIVQREDVSHRCRSLASGMKAMGVSGDAPTRAQMSTDRFGRNDADDRLMVAAAKLRPPSGESSLTPSSHR